MFDLTIQFTETSSETLQRLILQALYSTWHTRPVHSMTLHKITLHGLVSDYINLAVCFSRNATHSGLRFSISSVSFSLPYQMGESGSARNNKLRFYPRTQQSIRVINQNISIAMSIYTVNLSYCCGAMKCETRQISATVYDGYTCCVTRYGKICIHSFPARWRPPSIVSRNISLTSTALVLWLPYKSVCI